MGVPNFKAFGKRTLVTDFVTAFPCVFPCLSVPNAVPNTETLVLSTDPVKPAVVPEAATASKKKGMAPRKQKRGTAASPRADKNAAGGKSSAAAPKRHSAPVKRRSAFQRPFAAFHRPFSAFDRCISLYFTAFRSMPFTDFRRISLNFCRRTAGPPRLWPRTSGTSSAFAVRHCLCLYLPLPSCG